MKQQSLKKLFAFIITLTMFSALPQLAGAQNKKPRCNCLVRPIPFRCGQICGWLVSVHSTSGANSSPVQFESTESKNVSIKIYDGAGTLVRTLFDVPMTQGEHQMEWDAKDKNGNAVPAGIYILQLKAGGKMETKKLYVVS